MQEAVIAPLIRWENFYVIIGSAAASLTGLMFIVVTLVAGIRIQQSSHLLGAFSTPTIVHFCLALLIAALLNAPWQALWNVEILLGLIGSGGVVYVVIVLQRTRHQTDYQLVLEDWLWHTILPFASYIALIVTAIMLLIHPVMALFIVAAATLLLIFIGIHNAWDTIAYLVVERIQPENKS